MYVYYIPCSWHTASFGGTQASFLGTQASFTKLKVHAIVNALGKSF